MPATPSALLVTSALANFVVSLAGIFAGDELLTAFGAAGTPLERALVQLVGAGLFGFAMLNWMSRFATIGGIYGRPLVVANLAHTVTAALAILQIIRRGGATTSAIAGLACYAVFAVGFGVTLFVDPTTRSRQDTP